MRVAWLEDPELNYSMLAFEDEEGGDFFAVQRAFTFDEQDRSLGIDTYCLVRGEATHYGGLDSYEVTDSLLLLRFGGAQQMRFNFRQRQTLRSTRHKQRPSVCVFLSSSPKLER